MITSRQEGSVELIYELGRRRLQRELRRRETALREADRPPRAAEPKPKATAAKVETAVPKPEGPVAQHASTARERWECDFCGRDFHGYGQFLNHNCHDDY
jgi:hypothetical protein